MDSHGCWSGDVRDKGNVTGGKEGLCAGVGKFSYTQKTKESQCEGCPKHDGIKFLGKGRTQKLDKMCMVIRRRIRRGNWKTV